MLSPAADPAPPLTVLVLAWDETTPAVRALLEATRAPDPALASVLVMVPRAEAPHTLSAEEYLPLPPNLEAPAAPMLPAAALAPALLPALAPVTDALLPLSAALPPPAAPAPAPWAAVRVLRLSGQPLPELARRAGRPLPAPTWTGAATAPAAPYQGSTFLLTANAAPYPLAAAEPAGPAATDDNAPTYKPAEPLALAPDAEADWPATAVAGALRQVEPGAAGPAPAEPPTPSPAPEPGSWPEALAALRYPVAPPTPETPAPTPPAGTQPAASLYDTPNLNFQVIQYARFAVPVALAEAPFAAIYAPAWPTWLAAQELRQRTGQPLVLHVAALAASADEPLDEAAGWMAELQRQALRRADVILTETAALAQRLCHELGLPGTCVHTVPAADADAVAQALHAARPRAAAVPT